MKKARCLFVQKPIGWSRQKIDDQKNIRIGRKKRLASDEKFYPMPHRWIAEGNVSKTMVTHCTMETLKVVE